MTPFHQILPALVFSLVFLSSVRAQDPVKKPVVAKIQEEKAEILEAEAAVENVEKVRIQPNGNFYVRITEERGQNLHLSHFPSFKIDDQIMAGFQAGRFGKLGMNKINLPLPKTASGRERKGYMNVWSLGDIQVTQTVELTPTKAPTAGGKRQYGAALVKYVLENQGKQAHQVGVRTYIDTYVISNDACQFAAPNRPGKILDGVEFKGKDVPDFVQALERPDLTNPGYVAHLTLNLGLEKPERLVLTRHGTAGQWDMPAQGGGGDSALGFYFETKELRPGAKREVGYAYGQAVATLLSAEGRFHFDLSGSFEPGKLFTIAAQVLDPMPGQTLVLELPPGLELVEGKEIHPVAEPVEGSPFSRVLWKCRVKTLGAHPIRMRSNNGVIQTKVLNLTAG